jgi:hypothetical protein
MNSREHLRSVVSASNSLGGVSPHFAGTIGRTVSPGRFPSANYRIDRSRWDYEGNWAFCLFDNPACPAARFGFGLGNFDARDYGGAKPKEAFLWPQIEIMTRDGAVLWIPGTTYDPDSMRIAKRGFGTRVQAGQRDILRLTGWPNMHWQLASADGTAAVDMRLEVQNVTILPDCIMPRNRFAMWVCICRARGELRHGRKRFRVSGTAFFDHPRIAMVKNRVPTFGWYLYNPIRLSNGAHLISYFAKDAHGRCLPDYCFGLYLEPSGRTRWLRTETAHDLKLDADGRLKSWRTAWRGEDFVATATAVVRDTAVLKAWGHAGTPRTRKDYGNIPLVFDAQLEVRKDGRKQALSGTGLAEYMPVQGVEHE